MLMLFPAGCSNKGQGDDLESDFQRFLDSYIHEIHERNTDYLREVHPDLPPEMQDFFLDATLQMMMHAEEQGLEPSVECREYEVCKVTWPQSGGSWAAQEFIRHEGAWHFLP